MTQTVIENPGSPAPKALSVILPTFDRQELTDRAIDSLCARAPGRIEIIVVDDAGPTPYKAPAASNRCGIDIRVIRLASNGGPSVARAHGVRHAAANHVAFLDSDDLCAEGWIDYCLERIAAGLEGGMPRFITMGMVSGGNVFNGMIHRRLSRLPARLQRSVTRALIPIVNLFYTPAIAMHRDLFKATPQLRHGEDYYSIMHAIFRADVVLITAREACTLGRTPGSVGGLSANAKAMFRGEWMARRLAVRHGFIPRPYVPLSWLGCAYQLVRALRRKLRGAGA